MSTTLKVAETDSRLVGLNYAIIDPLVMDRLHLSAGDVIEVSSKKRKSHAKIWRYYPVDEGLGLIRIDGYTRNNIGVGLDDSVTIAKSKARSAEEITLAPTEALNISGLEEALPDALQAE